MTQRKKPQILQREEVAASRLFRIEQLHLKFANEVERVYECLKGQQGGAVMIVPIKNDALLLAREYAAGTHSYELGFPKGLIDAGEMPIEAANRELQEELGFAANNLVLLKEVTLAPGYFSSKMQIFLAQDLKESHLPGDEPEPIEMVTWPLADWQSLVSSEDFSESRSVAALFLALKHLGIDN